MRLVEEVAKYIPFNYREYVFSMVYTKDIYPGYIAAEIEGVLNQPIVMFDEEFKAFGATDLKVLYVLFSFQEPIDKLFEYFVQKNYSKYMAVLIWKPNKEIIRIFLSRND